MGEHTEISWTDHTFNPWWGCVRVSPGCEHCYAEAFAKRTGNKVWGVGAERRFFGDAHWAEPLKWNAASEKAGRRARVFCASMADVFEDRDDLKPWREQLWALIEATPSLDWQLLTKRPENISRLMHPAFLYDPPQNVWLGTTAEDQRRADERIPLLLQTPAAVRFVSAEPLLGPVSIADLDDGAGGVLKPLCGLHWQPTPARFGSKGLTVLKSKGPTINWVIVGGESGPGARPFDLAWARTIVADCAAAGVACFVKQLGRVPVHTPANWGAQCGVGLRDRKGGDIEEWPADLRVREFPVPRDVEQMRMLEEMGQ